MEATDKLQVVLLGTTGSGKSSSGNTILGEKLFKSSASTQSTTLSCHSETRIVNGMEVTVVDTPGWHCTKMSVNNVASTLMTAIAELNGPYAFLMVIPIGSFTHKEIQMITNLNQILGEKFMKQTTILFSFSDNLESKSFEQFLDEEKGELRTIIDSCGNRKYTWNNKDMSSVCNLDEMLQVLKGTQRMNDNSKKRYQNAQISQIEPDVNTFNEIGFPNVDMKRSKIDRCPEPLENEEVRVVVLGMTGEGKTSTIRTLLGQNFQIESSMPNVHMTSRSGMNFKLIDSSGFKKGNEMKNVISQAFSHASPGPHVIMIVIKVGRVTEETFKMIKDIQACLDNSIKHTMIVFSKRDELEDKTIKEFIKESPTLRNIVEMHESRFSALNNRDINDQTQVDELFEKISKMYHDNDHHFVKESSGQHGRVNVNKVKTEHEQFKLCMK